MPTFGFHSDPERPTIPIVGRPKRSKAKTRAQRAARRRSR